MKPHTVIKATKPATYIAAAALVVLVLALAACGGGGDPSTGPTPTPRGFGKVITPTPLAMVIPASGTEIAPVSTPTPTAVVQPTATPTPPPRTVDEEITGELVDNISSEEYPRTNARVLERSFRREPGFAEANLGKSFLIQGEVIIADRREDGVAFVEFKAGNGKVTCDFEIISDAELRRFTPDGTNAVTGTVSEWDAEERILSVEGCRVVLGF